MPLCDEYLYLPMKFFNPYLLAITMLCTSASAAENEMRWHVVLAAVGNEQHVFDNFVTDFADELEGNPAIASITELHASIDERWEPSGFRDLENTLSTLTPQQNEGCLVYLTGHGAPEGLAMSADIPIYFVRTSRMESMLEPCADRTTVLVISACYSGIYMRRGITRPERIVFTASDEDLTSFGCSNNNRYTFFDQCFMNAWSENRTWGMLGDDINGCVRQTERSNYFPSSKPQFFFGPGLEALPLPKMETANPG